MRQEYIIAHYHEIALKGNNRPLFVRRLISNIRTQLAGLSVASVTSEEGRIVIAHHGADEDVGARLSRVFGISSFSPAVMTAPTIQSIQDATVKSLFAYSPASPSAEHSSASLRFCGTRHSAGKRELEIGKRAFSFAVRTKRSDKNFPYTSEETNRLVGKVACEALSLSVNLTNPEIIVGIEILSRHAYITMQKMRGPGGLPVGSGSRAVALLSGGIDSPVAAWRIMKRGAEIIFVHFHSYPHTSRASIDKVRELAKIVGAYQPQSKLYLIPFADAQREIVMLTLPRYRVILYRRLMMRIAARVAEREQAVVLVTGESLGQVASQTMENIAVVENSSALPVFRPLVGFDKEEIISEAKRIGTYEISIMPHDDCCTLFIPKNPVTKSRLVDVLREEAKLDIQRLVEVAMYNADTSDITPSAPSYLKSGEQTVFPS